jgi:NAD(P)-dependent dehydrogenase (short-subunit alcohol dehydrogenase family)
LKLRGDVTDEQMVKVVASEVDRRFGKLDVPINNATLFPDRLDTVGADLAEVSAVFGVNFMGAWNMINTLLPY